MSEGLVGALAVLVPGLVGFVAYLGTRGANKVSRQAQFDQAVDRLVDQLQEEVTRLNALVESLRAQVAQLEYRLREGTAP